MVNRTDLNGRTWGDFMRGVSEAFIDDANPNPIAKPLSNSSNPNNQTHYAIGQTLGHVVAAVTGALETVEGGGTTLGGATIAVTGSEFVAPIPVGGAIALAGATEAAHGLMMTSKATGNLAKNANSEPNGNSKSSTKPQHNYDIKDTETGKVVKTGLSGGKETKTGNSYRGTSQANKWNKQEKAPGKYRSEITNRIKGGKGAREKGLDYEKNRATQVRPELDPSKHKRP